MDCELLQGCPFYNEKMPMENGIGSIYKKKYCKDNNKLCARYKVATALGLGSVPNNLYPNMHDIAMKIIEEIKN
jgi:hypothetical protein